MRSRSWVPFLSRIQSVQSVHSLPLATFLKAEPYTRQQRAGLQVKTRHGKSSHHGCDLMGAQTPSCTWTALQPPARHLESHHLPVLRMKVLYFPKVLAKTQMYD